MLLIAITNVSLPAKKRILTVCVRLFLEQGYKKTTVAEIVQKASVSNSIFQNIFRAKDGVLTELTEFMFSNQFSMARGIAGTQLSPVFIYAVEIGSAGLMRGFMVQPCDETLTLEKKLRAFLSMSLRAYCVPEDEVEKTLAFIAGLDIRQISEGVMHELFRALAMRYEFSLQGIDETICVETEEAT